MKILILSYYWPPAGGSGVQRWLFMAGHLADLGHDVSVFVPGGESYPMEDKTLVDYISPKIKVLKPAFPKGWFQALTNKQIKNKSGFLSEKSSFKGELMKFVRANFFFPDAKQYLIKPSVKYLSNLLKEESFDYMISSGPPHSMHLVAYVLKQKFDIKWAADFRDPWTDIDYFHHLPFLKVIRQKHFNVEKKVLKSADKILVVGNQMKERYQKLNPATYVLYNGFEGELMKEKAQQGKLHVSHTGLINADRNPSALWKALANAKENGLLNSSNFVLHLAGKLDESIIRDVESFDIQDLVNLDGYLNRSQVEQLLDQSDILLLLLNDVPSSKGILTGKVFEYFRANRRILAIGPKEGDLDVLLKETGRGVLYDFSDSKGLLDYFKHCFDSQNQGVKLEEERIKEFSRFELSKKLISILED